MSLGSEEMMEEFRIEMAEIAQGLDEALLRWERDPGNPDLPEKIFRQLHTLKGSSGFMELFDLSELCHAAEDIISAFRKGAPLPLPVVQALLTQTVGQARQILDVRIETAQHPHLKPLALELRNLAKNGVTAATPLLSRPDVHSAEDHGPQPPPELAPATFPTEPFTHGSVLDLSDIAGHMPSAHSTIVTNIVTSRPIVETPAVRSHRPEMPRSSDVTGPSVLPSSPPGFLPVRSSAVLMRSPAATQTQDLERPAPWTATPPERSGPDAQSGPTQAPREGTLRSVHPPTVTPRYSTPSIIRRPLPDPKSSARKALRITQTGLMPPQEGALLGSSLLGDHRDPPGPLDPGALGPWSHERLNALKEGHSPASLRAAGLKQDPASPDTGVAGRMDPLRRTPIHAAAGLKQDPASPDAGVAGRIDPLKRTPVQGAAESTLGTLQKELEVALKRDPFLTLASGAGPAGGMTGGGLTGSGLRPERLDPDRSGASTGPLPRRAEDADPIELLLSGEALPSDLRVLLKAEQGEAETHHSSKTGIHTPAGASAAQAQHPPPHSVLEDHSDLEVAILTPERRVNDATSVRAPWGKQEFPGNPGSGRGNMFGLPAASVPDRIAGSVLKLEPSAPEPSPAQQESLVSGLDDSGLFIDRATTVRVDVSKLDTLLNLMGDLLQEKYRQNRLVEELTERDPDNPTVAAMASSHRRFERQLSQLQDAVLSTRMLPVQGVFRRYPRIVKDLAARLGKEVELVIEGEQTELDRALLEGLFEPLIHLLRNSIDHGVGTPVERIRSNKSRKGTITLSASQEGNQIVLEIRDDGRGIDPDEMVSRAIKLKLLDPDRAKELNEQEKIDLIFLAGFTSRPEVTETSGRGVGMSVVRDHLRRIGGLITVQSKKGTGTTLRIAMPLTLAILQVLLVRVGKGQYAIPLSSVVGAWRVEREQLTLYRGGWYLPRPGSMLPLFSLSALLGLEPPSLPPERCYVAEVGVAEKRYGIWVTGFEGIYESVIKSLEGSLTRLPGVAGGTFIGTGDMVLVLDMGALLEGQLTSRRD